MAVHYNGRTVAISSIHVGVDSAALRHLMVSEPQIEVDINTLKQQFVGRRVILGIDRYVLSHPPTHPSTHAITSLPLPTHPPPQ